MTLHGLAAAQSMAGRLLMALGKFARYGFIVLALS